MDSRFSGCAIVGERWMKDENSILKRQLEPLLIGYN
jgi:hypothetical protein